MKLYGYCICATGLTDKLLIFNHITKTARKAEAPLLSKSDFLPGMRKQFLLCLEMDGQQEGRGSPLGGFNTSVSEIDRQGEPHTKLVLLLNKDHLQYLWVPSHLVM